MARSNLWKAVGLVSAFVLAMTLAASAQTFTAMMNFNNNNGQNPWSSIIQATDGNFYGTTYWGGQFNQGTVFKVTPTGTMTVLWSFTNGCDGANPVGPLFQASDGNFYGTTYQGGSHQYGSVFKITPNGNLLCLHGFSYQEGGNPMGGLIQGSDGALYGTTSGGSPWDLSGRNLARQVKRLDFAGNAGTVFKITTDGSTFTTLHFFCTSCGDGNTPVAGLVQGGDGTLYGTTYWGGGYDYGVVFSLATDGSNFQTLHSFRNVSGSPGANPAAPLIFGHDGYLYSTTQYGGHNNDGSVFKVSTDGTSFITLFTFNGYNGANPVSGLALGFDNKLYGTTSYGGEYGYGTLFRINPSMTINFVLLHSFDYANGATPWSGLIQAVNGAFYGTTVSGGASGMGTIFSTSAVPQQFIPVTPCRLLDTRTTNNPLVGGISQDFDLLALAQSNNCTDMSHVYSYALNVTLVPRYGSVGYVTLWPTGSTMPIASTMNAVNGQIKANAAIVPAGVNKNISIYASDTTDVILDVSGYFVESNWNALQFYTLTPCRVVDTRAGTSPLGGPYLTGNVPRQFPIMTSSCFAGLNNPPDAYSFNVTVLPHQTGQPMAYLTIWPSNTDMPNVSTLNNVLGTATANAAFVAPGTGADGPVTVYAYNDTELIIDVNGYFAPATEGGFSFYPSMACRAMDTRPNAFSGVTTAAMMQTVCTPPVAPGAFVANATTVPTGPLGYLTLWGDGSDQPIVSTLNAYNGLVTSNLAIVPNVNGSIDAFAYGTTNLILDLNGYFGQ